MYNTVLFTYVYSVVYLCIQRCLLMYTVLFTYVYSVVYLCRSLLEQQIKLVLKCSVDQSAMTSLG